MKLFLEIKFDGGLGNQLFQYATARSLSLKNKIPYRLFNIDNYKNKSLNREFSLSNYKVKGTVLKQNTLKKLFRKDTKLNNFLSVISLHKTIKENGFVIHDLSSKGSLLTSLHGFWQSSNYFNDIRPLLLNEFVPKQIPALPEWINQQNTVAVHVRRTDYLEEKRYGFIGEQYYHKAIQSFENKIEHPIFIFFSDDLKWCKENFTKGGILFCDEVRWAKDYLQLYLMSKCKHQIIANSSFSWWGAWLNNNPDKIVIRPAKPFVNAELLYESHYPEGWLIVNN